MRVEEINVEEVCMQNLLRPALSIFIVLTLLTGGLYPLLVTVLGQALFPAQVAGSLLNKNGKVVGSSLIGQNFSAPKYFWGRLSATGPQPYNSAASSGSNLGPLNPLLLANAKNRIAALRAADPANTAPLPIDLITASGSGLDPHISPAAAQYQLARVARVRDLDKAVVAELIRQNTAGRQFGIFGEPRVNVLALNLALDTLPR
jgi:potassium-transporting ATPase KdpC subunit